MKTDFWYGWYDWFDPIFSVEITVGKTYLRCNLRAYKFMAQFVAWR